MDWRDIYVSERKWWMLDADTRKALLKKFHKEFFIKRKLGEIVEDLYKRGQYSLVDFLVTDLYYKVTWP